MFTAIRVAGRNRLRIRKSRAEIPAPALVLRYSESTSSHTSSLDNLPTLLCASAGPFTGPLSVIDRVVYGMQELRDIALVGDVHVAI